MKKILIVAAFLTLLLLIGKCGWSQSDSYISVTYSGYTNGEYNLVVTDLQSYSVSYSIGFQNVTPTAISGGGYPYQWGGTAEGTYTLSITAPYTSSAVFTFTILTNSGLSNHNPVVVSIPTDLPVTITQFSVQESKQDQVSVSWTAEMESNVDYYVIQASSDGDNFVGVDTVNSYWPEGTSAVPHVYNETYDNARIIKEAGMGAVAFLLVLGIVVGMIKKGPFVARCAALFLFSYSINACTKQITTPTTTVSKYQYFRLVEVDLDGTLHYDQQTVVVK
jgi:hypothetical protein